MNYDYFMSLSIRLTLNIDSIMNLLLMNPFHIYCRCSNFLLFPILIIPDINCFLRIRFLQFHFELFLIFKQKL